MIVEDVISLLRRLKKYGTEVNGTKEFENIILRYHPYMMDLENEENRIEEYYNNKIENYGDRIELEKTHYQRLHAAMIHEMTRGQWFTNFDKKQAVSKFAEEHNLREEADEFNSKIKLDDFSGRRNLIFSQDCISSIQLLCRENKNTMTAVIRSSDVLRLLPIDILFLCGLLNKVLDYHNIKKNKIDELFILIVSTHYYIKDDWIVSNII